MSGLGVIYDASGAPVERCELELLLSAIEHRGSQETVWIGPGVALGQRVRHARGQDDGDPRGDRGEQRDLYPLVLDGRLDNKPDLVAALGAASGNYSDGELIALAYERWSERCVERFVGDFAFVLWDPVRRRIFAARDQRGFRPLVFARYGRRIVFGSEPRQLFADRNVPRTRDELFLACHLMGAPPAPGSTPFASIAEVPPAHYAVVEDGWLSLREYWRYSPRPKLNYKTRSEYVEHFDELFSRVMSETVQARGPVGVLLSGGIDSSYVALKAKEAGAEIKAVSLFVPDSSEMDERKYSRSVAGALGMESIEIDASDCWSLSSGAISDLQFDQPYHPMQAPALMLACEAARQDGMQVLLDGAGGDELFTGGWDYAAHLAIQGRWAQAFREVRDWSSDAGVSTLRALRYAVFSPLIPASVRAWVRRLGGNAVPSPVPPWLDPIAMRACRLDKALDVPTLPPVWQTENRAALFWAYFLADVLPAMAWWERHASLPNGVEARSPLWDLRVIEFVLGTPEWVHRSGGRTKAILREAMAGRLPAEVQNRADKGLFSSLMYRGIADNETERVRSALRGELSELIYVKPSVLEREFEVLCERRHIWWTPIWRAVTAGLWLQSDSVSCGQSDGRSVLTASGRRDD